jgi:hypothetical protein
MPRPSFSIRSVAIQPVELPAGIRFEFVHESLRSNAGFHDRMHVVASHVRSQQSPTAVGAMPPQSCQDGRPAVLVQPVWRLWHPLTLLRVALRIWLQQAASRQIVMPVHGARLRAVQVSAVARESNEIPQAPLPCGRGSVWGTTTERTHYAQISSPEQHFSESITSVLHTPFPGRRPRRAKLCHNDQSA